MRKIDPRVGVAGALAALLAIGGCASAQRGAAQTSHPAVVSPSVGQQKTVSEDLTERSWWFVRNTDHTTPRVDQAGARLVEKYEGIWIGPTDQKKVYLTFDNGYENGYTPKVLDALKRNHVPAIFFVTGHYVDSHPELVKRMVQEGHLVGNHTEHHPNLTKVSDEKLAQELQSVSDKVEQLTGQKMRFMRPPEGTYNEHVLAQAKKLGYRTVFWTEAIADWKPLPGGPQEAHDKIVSGVHPGAVILLHAVSPDDVQVLDQMIRDIRAQGYTFERIDTILEHTHTDVPS
ncbi:MAG: delta-lactam-biosynthetic de-N-acetylase [Firmicutes bacterium]|nr:delta-lactam-biosynthetic de-N-acetylase [Bacillota bacterium]